MNLTENIIQLQEICNLFSFDEKKKEEFFSLLKLLQEKDSTKVNDLLLTLIFKILDLKDNYYFNSFCIQAACGLIILFKEENIKIETKLNFFAKIFKNILSQPNETNNKNASLDYLSAQFFSNYKENNLKISQKIKSFLIAIKIIIDLLPGIDRHSLNEIINLISVLENCCNEYEIYEENYYNLFKPNER